MVRTCSPRETPEMTEVTAGCAARPAMATSSSDRSRFSAYDASASMRSQSASCSQLAREGTRRHASPMGVAAAGVLAGEQAVLQGEIRQDSESEPLGGGNHLLLDGAIEERVAVLHRDEGLEALPLGGPGGVGHLPAGEVGAPDVPDLALAHQLGQRLERLPDRCDRVGECNW